MRFMYSLFNYSGTILKEKAMQFYNQLEKKWDKEQLKVLKNHEKPSKRKAHHL